MKKTLHIIKIGGNILDNPERLSAFLKDFSTLKGLNILVHGGGKIATDVGNRLGIVEYKVEGRRITDASTLELVTMVYGGLINKNLVVQLQALGCNALGLSGADANILPAVKRPIGHIDYGFVGDIESSSLDPKRLQVFLNANLSLVIAPLTHDGMGKILNTNADTIASAIACLLSGLYETSLYYCFEKEGVLDNQEEVIPYINENIFAKLKQDGVISEGMIPKIFNAMNAIKGGVKAVHILKAEAITAVINYRKNKGTLIVP